MNNLKWQNYIKKYLPDYLSYFRHLSYSNFANSQIDYININDIPFNDRYCMRYTNYYSTKFPLFYKQVYRLLNNHYKKKKRIKNKIDLFFCQTELLYFGTLTFTDETLKSTSQETRRKYVRRFLKENCVNYIANIDFGDNTNREHYHCIFIANNSNFFDNWKYGFVNVKNVNVSQNFNAISEYILKLTNHSIKNSANYVIYSRGC